MADFVNGRTLDRVPRWDTRNENHRVRALGLPVVIPENFTRERVTWLNQGSEGGCVGFSGTTVLSFPDDPQPELSQENAEWLYSLAKDYDEYPGRDYEGSSVLGSAQGLKDKGVIGSYYWATTVEEICLAISSHSAVNFGINWYAGMFDCVDGIVTLSGGLSGGHAIGAGAYQHKGELIRLDNTWGKGWGVDGSGWIKGESIERLLKEEGECAVFAKVNPFVNLGVSGRVDPDPSGGVVAPE